MLASPVYLYTATGICLRRSRDGDAIIPYSNVTRGHHCIDHTSSYPTEHMRWALVGLQNALTFLHVDCEGLGTDITVADGGKAWGFVHERPGNPLSSINFFLKDSFRLNEVVPLSKYDFEVVALRPGDRL